VSPGEAINSSEFAAGLFLDSMALDSGMGLLQPLPAGGQLCSPLEPLRLPAGAIGREIFEAPGKFDFFEAVLLLQKIAADFKSGPNLPVGGFARPAQECLRFSVPHCQAFPTSTIQSICWDAEQSRPIVNVNFMGLTGPSGVLPRVYNERLQKIESVSRQSERYALRDWLDNFNHRLISLFFDAWCKYRFPVAMRRQMIEQTQGQGPVLIRVALSAFAGLKTATSAASEVGSTGASVDVAFRPAMDRDELLSLAGLLAQRPMNVSNLHAAAERCLGVPIHIEQFDGCWLELEADSQTRLGESGCQLGQDAILGERIWSRQQKIRIDVGPLKPADFRRFLPPTAEHPADGYQRLCELIRVCVGHSLNFDIHPVLQLEENLDLELSAERSAVRLGIDSWLGTPLGTAVSGDAVFSGAV
jgi:type VI secretion system protein ImpH